MGKRTREQRKADNIAAETQRRINEGDTSAYVQRQIASNPGQFENTERVAQKQQAEVRRSAYEEMAKAGIKSLSGATTTDKARETQRKFYEDRGVSPGRIEELVPTPTETVIEKTKKKKLDQYVDDFFTKKVSGLKFPTLGMGAVLTGSLQGFGSTDRFFKNLQESNQGAGLSSRDLVTLVNLMQRSGENPLKFLENYAEKNNLSEAETRDLVAKFNRAYSNLGSKVSSSGIMNYLDTKPEGFKDSLSAMFGQYEGDQVPGRTREFKFPNDPDAIKDYEKNMRLYEETGEQIYLDRADHYIKFPNTMVDRPTRENVIDKLGTEGLEYLKATNPSLYYLYLRPPSTSGEMEDLAQLSMPTGENRNSPENKRLSYEIQQAREAVSEQDDRQKERLGGGQYWTPGGGGGGGTDPGDEDDTDPGDENQWMTAGAGQIGYYNPEINPATGMPWGYQWGTMDQFSQYAEVNPTFSKDGGIIGLYNGGYLNDSNGVIGLDGGGYLDDYRTADSLMFKDPQEDEEWEYNV